MRYSLENHYCQGRIYSTLDNYDKIVYKNKLITEGEYE